MKAVTLKALRLSIRRWQAKARATDPARVRIGTACCPLCQLYFFRGCVECPVRERTGHMLCTGTPYGAATAALVEWRRGERPGKKAARAMAATAEVAFLKSLLCPGQ